MRATPDVARAAPTPARRRRERRTISFLRCGQMTVKMLEMLPEAALLDRETVRSPTCYEGAFKFDPQLFRSLELLSGINSVTLLTPTIRSKRHLTT